MVEHLFENLKDSCLDLRFTACWRSHLFAADDAVDARRRFAEDDLFILAFRATDFDEFADWVYHCVYL